jgi:hypothetical protein
MSDDELRWIARAAVDLDCLIYVWRGRFGLQPVFFPWSLARSELTSE